MPLCRRPRKKLNSAQLCLIPNPFSASCHIHSSRPSCSTPPHATLHYCRGRHLLPFCRGESSRDQASFQVLLMPPRTSREGFLISSCCSLFGSLPSKLGKHPFPLSPLYTVICAAFLQVRIHVGPHLPPGLGASWKSCWNPTVSVPPAPSTGL